MNKQTKLIVSGAALIGGGILLYYLLKPKKKTRFEQITQSDSNINQQLKDFLNKQAGYNKEAAKQITGGAQWVPTQEQSVVMYPSLGTPNATGTGIFIKSNPYG